MMKEERILEEKFGKVNHFTVPEGYFDSFADKLMEQLPATEERVIKMRAQVWWRTLPLRKIAAVVGVCAMIGGSALFFTHNDGLRHTPVASVEHEHMQSAGGEYGSFDEMADYAMIDNQDIYASLVAEN